LAPFLIFIESTFQENVSRSFPYKNVSVFTKVRGSPPVHSPGSSSIPTLHLEHLSGGVLAQQKQWNLYVDLLMQYGELYGSRPHLQQTATMLMTKNRNSKQDQKYALRFLEGKSYIANDNSFRRKYQLPSFPPGSYHH